MQKITTRSLLALLLSTLFLFTGCEKQKTTTTGNDASAEQSAVAGKQTAPVNGGSSDHVDESTPKQHQPQQHSDLLQKVTVIGASVSAGMGAQLVWNDGDTARIQPLVFADVIDATIRTSHRPVRSHASSYFFSDADQFGEKFITQTLKDDPTLVIGLDFLFWFTYGTYFPSENADTMTQRLNDLQKGLDLAGKIHCPMVLGDIPDMHGAAEWMLPDYAIPPEDELKAINKRIHQWADKHENVIILPLAEMQRKIKNKQEIRVGENTWAGENVGQLLLADGLHPSGEGQIALGQLVFQTLLDSDWNVNPDGLILNKEEALLNLRKHLLALQEKNEEEPSNP